MDEAICVNDGRVVPIAVGSRLKCPICGTFMSKPHGATGAFDERPLLRILDILNEARHDDGLWNKLMRRARKAAEDLYGDLDKLRQEQRPELLRKMAEAEEQLSTERSE